MTQLDKIFATISERYDPGAMPGFNTTVQFDLGPHAFHLVIDEGSCDYGQGQVENPEATITMPPEDFEALVKGDLNPMMAFMQGKIKVDGNMSTVMKLQTLLAGG